MSLLSFNQFEIFLVYYITNQLLIMVDPTILSLHLTYKIKFQPKPLINLPSRRNVIGVWRPGSDFSRQPKVGYLDQLRPAAEYIFRFEIPVEKSMAVHERQTGQDLL